MKNLNQFLIKTALTFITLTLLSYSLKLVLTQFNQAQHDELQALKKSLAYVQPHPSPRPTFSLPQIQTIEQPSTTVTHSNITGNVNIYLPLIITFYRNPKKGLGAAYPAVCQDMNSLHTSWYFNWNVYPDPNCSQFDTKFIPMIFDGNNMLEPYFSEAIKQAQVSGWLMGFNEPNLPSVGNVSPEDGAIYWKHLEEVALPLGIKLISPAPSPLDIGQTDYYSQGSQWIWEMSEAYQRQNKGRKPHFDALAWHIYHYDPKVILNFLNKRHQEALARGYNAPFWVTEYSGSCSYIGPDNSVNETIMTQITPWLNQTPWIDRYAWFASRFPTEDTKWDQWRNCLMLEPNTGNPNKLGQMYREY